MKQKSLKTWQLRTFILCWFAYACIYFGRVNLSVAIPEIQDFLGASKTQVGIIASLFFWVYGIGQLINGYIGDKVSSRLYIFIGLIVTASANILFGFSTSLIIMVVLWAVNGFFQSMLWGPMAKTITYWVSPEKRSSAAIGISTSIVGGFLMAWGLSGQILEHLNWKWIFWIPGIFILLYSVVWYAGIRDHPEDIGLKSPNKEIYNVNEENDIKTHLNYSLWEVIKKTRLWLVVVACLAQGIVKDGINLWAPTFLMETHNLDIKSTTSLIIAIPVMNFCGVILAGWLNKKFMYREKITTIVLFVIGIFMIVGLNTLGATSIFLGIIFLGLSSAMMYGANTLLLGVIPMNFAKYNKVSSIAGALDFCSYIAAGFAASITGFIVDSFGWGSVLSFWVVVTILGSIALVVSQLYDNRLPAKTSELIQQ